MIENYNIKITWDDERGKYDVLYIGTHYYVNHIRLVGGTPLNIDIKTPKTRPRILLKTQGLIEFSQDEKCAVIERLIN